MKYTQTTPCKGKVSATLAMDMLKDNRGEELLQKLESGEMVANGSEVKETAPKPQRITAKNLTTKPKANDKVNLQFAITAIKALTKEEDINEACTTEYNQAICDVLDILEAL